MVIFRLLIWSRKSIIQNEDDRNHYLFDMMNYLACTTYAEELHDISLLIAKNIEEDIVKSQGQLKLNLMIVMGRFYYEKKEFDKCKDIMKVISNYYGYRKLLV